MEVVRAKQERLARMHFDLNSAKVLLLILPFPTQYFQNPLLGLMDNTEIHN